LSALIDVDALKAGYGPARVLHGVTVRVDEGEVAALLGPNGSGKTTTLRAISGMIRVDGRIVLGGRSIAGLAPERIARLGVAHVPEGRGTLRMLTVEENLRLGAYTRSDRTAVRADIRRCLGYFPALADRRNQPAGTLSGGEQQMLAIGRALMLRPRLVLLDEPSLGLAPKVTRSLFAVLRDVNRHDGVSMLIVEQNANLVLEFAKRAYVLEAGAIVIGGTGADVRADQDLRRAYLGY
jgi:branched-chain amino acid transport system ATP-binding protein